MNNEKILAHVRMFVLREKLLCPGEPLHLAAAASGGADSMALLRILLGAWRIARCNPFGKWGFDPVPEPGRWQNPARRLQPAKLFSTRHKQKVEK